MEWLNATAAFFLVDPPGQTSRAATVSTRAGPGIRSLRFLGRELDEQVMGHASMVETSQLRQDEEEERS